MVCARYVYHCLLRQFWSIFRGYTSLVSIPWLPPMVPHHRRRASFRYVDNRHHKLPLNGQELGRSMVPCQIETTELGIIDGGRWQRGKGRLQSLLRLLLPHVHGHGPVLNGCHNSAKHFHQPQRVWLDNINTTPFLSSIFTSIIWLIVVEGALVLCELLWNFFNEAAWRWSQRLWHSS